MPATRVRELASGVVPVAGLIAETGATLRETHVGWRQIAALPETSRDRLLLSVERFRDPDLNPLSEEIREELLERLGLFGLRLSVGLLADGTARTATDLSGALLERSGIRDLQRALADRYGARAQALKARSALAALRVVAESLDRRGVDGASDIVVAVDRLGSSSQELALLRLLHLVLTGAVELSPDERGEVDRLCGATSAGTRVGLEPDAPRPPSATRHSGPSNAGAPAPPARSAIGARWRLPRSSVAHTRDLRHGRLMAGTGLAHCNDICGGRGMDTGTFYATTSAVSFTLLGFWWVVVQFRHEEMTATRAVGGSGVRRVAPLHPARPDVARRAVDDGCAVVWRLTFGTAGVAGMVAVLLASRGIAGPDRRDRQRSDASNGSPSRCT